jgi:hypothetical protein
VTDTHIAAAEPTEQLGEDNPIVAENGEAAASRDMIWRAQSHAANRGPNKADPSNKYLVYTHEVFTLGRAGNAEGFCSRNLWSSMY